MYKSHMKNVMYLAAKAKLSFASAILSLGKHCLLLSLANGIKNDITSPEKHIIICLLKIE